MKITEYIENTDFLNEKNHIELFKNLPIIHSICKHNKYKVLNYSSDFLENDNIIDLFTPFLISNAHFNRQKIKKSIKSIVGISPTMVLLFLLLFLFLKK
jgi:hypothetical protein